MAVTLATIRSLTRTFIDDVGGERWSDAELLSLINEAQRNLQQVIDDADEGFFSQVQACAVVATVDALEFALPDGLRKVVQAEREVSGGDPIPAVWVPFQRRHEDWATPSFYRGLLPGAPVCYLRGSKVGVVSPSDSYTLRLWYTYSIADLAQDTDVSEIPVEYRNLIALQAARLTKGRDSATAFPPALEAEYQDGMKRLALFTENRQRQQPRSVVYMGE